MGFVSALVVSPCVSAPLAGALVYISTTGDAVLGGLALLALSLGMGVPLLLVGAGGGKWLPRAGNWMLHIKAFFGVILLGVAIALLARLLPESTSALLWSALIVFYAIHLWVGRFDNTTSGWLKTRQGVSVMLLLYGMSLFISALAGSGNLQRPLAFLAASSMPEQTTNTNSTALFQRIQHVPTLNQAVELALNSQKAVVIDLYADWCASCVSLEKKVFNQAELRQYQEKVVFLQLDMTQNNQEHSDYLSQHPLFGPPSLLFIKADGTTQPSFQGEPSLSALTQRLDNLLAGQ
jgi:thiol:disulfide interchange protein DsbD